MSNREKQIEYGDFQTPFDLAQEVANLLSKNKINPASIVEPTCGEGNFFLAATKTFPKARKGLAFDIDTNYVKKLKSKLSRESGGIETKVGVADFFAKDWWKELKNIPEPILIIGNPPWVTNSQLGQIQSENLPSKYNFNKLRGLDAMTGKSNFDISEWMMGQMVEWLQEKEGTMAMLCKTSVARKVLMNAWKNENKIAVADMHLIDSKKHFDISADACLLTISSSNKPEKRCRVYQNLDSVKVLQTIGYKDGFLVANIPSYEKNKHLIDGEQYYEWRTGVKHDSAKVMELKKTPDGFYVNGYGERIELEDKFIFPLLKGSCLSNGKIPERFLLVPQTKVGQDTDVLLKLAPKTWEYLSKYGDILDKRKSSIYKNKPRFSVFGVGDYTFKQWKVAIPALYKELSFSVIGPYQDKTVVFDDTVNFIAADSEQEARELANLLNSNIARDFYHSFIFWDNKRPITVQLLKTLDIDKLSKEMGVNTLHQTNKRSRQLPLLAG